MKDIEVELKFSLADKAQLLKFLYENATFLKETYQKDSYFTPTHRDFFASRPVNERLRIRQSEKGKSINYKNRKEKDGEQLNYCDEYETSIGDADVVEKIFKALDINPLIVVNKKRLSYLYQEVEISVDEVEELGDFVELEMKGTFTSKDEAVETLYLLAETLGLSRETEDKKGYPYLLLEQKELL